MSFELDQAQSLNHTLQKQLGELRAQNQALRDKVAQLEHWLERIEPVIITKTVERVIEKPVIKIKEVERIVKQVINQPVYVDRVIEKPITQIRIVERIVEKPVIQTNTVYIDKIKTVNVPVHIDKIVHKTKIVKELIEDKDLIDAHKKLKADHDKLKQAFDRITARLGNDS
jgi:hypothetical protein